MVIKSCSHQFSWCCFDVHCSSHISGDLQKSGCLIHEYFVFPYSLQSSLSLLANCLGRVLLLPENFG